MKATEIGAKIIAALVLFIVTFGSTLLPHRLKEFSASERCLKNISCFCGGLFMGLCFLHLIPDALRDFNSVAQFSKVQKTYPMAEFIICVGMVIVMIAEKLATVIQSQRDENKCDASKDCCKDKCKKQGGNSSLYGSLNKSYQAPSNQTVSAPHSYEHESATQSSFTAEINDTFDDVILLDKGEQEIFVEETKDEKNSLSSSLSIRLGKEVRSKVIKTICLIIALMVHSLFEGLTVGLQKSTYGLIALVSVLAFHKSIIGFSLGMAIVNTDRGLRFHLKQAILFALASPFGIMAGAFLLSTKFNLFNEGAMAVLICLATGTFLYITFFEILSKNLVGNQLQDLISFAYFLIGFGIFAGITAIPIMQN